MKDGFFFEAFRVRTSEVDLQLVSEGPHCCALFKRDCKIDLRCPDTERIDGNTQLSCLASRLNHPDPGRIDALASAT